MNGVLHHLRSRVTRWLALFLLVLLLAIFAVLALGGILLDAAVDLPKMLRPSPGDFLAPGLVGFIVAIWFLRRRCSEAYLAWSWESKDPTLGNRLSNAVDLGKKSGDGPVQEFFRREAVALGRQSAAKLSAHQLWGRSLARALLVLTGALAAFAALTVSAPDLMRAELPRFLDPEGDHPPFSLLHFDVSPGASSVLFGGQIEVRATARGRPVDKLWLVHRAGDQESRAIMFLAPDKTFFQTLANVCDPIEYWVTDGRARSKRFPVTVLKTPQIAQVEVTTEFPEYTGKPPHTGKLSEEAQALPEETRVRFRVTSNRPLKSGTIELTPVLGGRTNRVNLAPEKTNGTMVSGVFAVTEAVAFTLSVRDTNGLESSDNRRGRFNILPDKPPRIFVLEPGKDAVATPATRVAVRVQATDDYAVARVAWLRGFNRSTERPLNLKLTLQAGPQSVEAEGVFDLAKLGVQPGDVIDYYFEAADNYPKWPNVVFSRPFRLEIITQKQYEDVLRQYAAQKSLFESYFKNDAWLRRLAERARAAAAKAAKSDPAARDDAVALAQQLDDYEKALQKLLQEPVNFDVEQSFRQSLADELAAIEAAKSKLDQALGAGVLDPETIRKLSEDMDELSKTEGKMVGVPAAEIANVAELLAAANSFVKLTKRQDALADMLDRFAGLATPMTRLQQMELEELAHQQQRVRDDLKQMLEQLPDLLDKVPREPAYEQFRQDVQDFLKAVSDLKIPEDLAAAAEALEVPDPRGGATLAAQAAAKMDQLVGKADASGAGSNGLTLRFGPLLLKPGLGNTLAQILGALGAGPGGSDGNDGYSLFNEDVAMYGSNAQLPAGEQASGRGDNMAINNPRTQQMAGDAQDSGLKQTETPGRVRLQPDAKFPLRYRELVGEYFRSVAESQKEGN